MSSFDDLSDEFVRALTEHQGNLMGFIMASVGDYTNASDILQQTNVVLLRKSSDLRSVDEFLPWAITIAKYCVLGFVRDQSRERLLFSPELSEAMAVIAAENVVHIPDRLSALRDCLKQLPESRVELLQQRYGLESSLQAMAQHCECSIDSIKGKLKRTRELLSRCVRARIAMAGE